MPSDPVGSGSPFASLPGAVGSPPEHFGNPIGEQRALASGRALVDLSDHGVVAVGGPDRLTWLDSITSQRLIGLPAGESAETLLLDPSGRVEHAFRLVDDGETSWLLLDPGAASPVAAFLERMRFRLDVAIADRSDEFATVGMIAPGAGDGSVVARALATVVWRDPWPAVAQGGWQYAATDDHPGVAWEYLEALVPRDRLGDLVAAATDGRITPAGTLALAALRIAAWRPAEATEVDGTTIPHELDWMRSAVHLSKGCYRGQETVAKVHNLGRPPRRLVLLHLDGSEGATIAAGDEVRAPGATDTDGTPGTPVGRVTSAAVHHELGPVALALVRRATDPAATLTVIAGDGTVVAAAQEQIVPPEAGATAGVPRLPRLTRR